MLARAGSAISAAALAMSASPFTHRRYVENISMWIATFLGQTRRETKPGDATEQRCRNSDQPISLDSRQGQAVPRSASKEIRAGEDEG
jgi:hypothetical protein